MMVVLLDVADGHEPPLDEAALGRLRQQGITSIELLRDERTLALVLDGWAFDPSRSGDAAVTILAGKRSARALQPFAHVAVSASSTTWLP